MANRDNPHGFRPTMRSVAGVPASAQLCHKLVGYGTALFQHDLVTRVASGIQPYPAISAAITPGTTPIFGVCMTWGAASTATNHLVIPGLGGQVFEAQDNGDVDGAAAANVNMNANAELNAGNTVTKISGHEVDESTIAVTNTLDLKFVGVWRDVLNAFGSNFVRMEVIINRDQLANQVAGL